MIFFDDAGFDKIFTVNTLYFWQNPNLLLNEIYRVLKPNGIFALTFADKSFMEKLPFTPFGFKLYSLKDVEELLQKNQFKILKSISQTEQVFSKTNEMVNRTFFIVLVRK